MPDELAELPLVAELGDALLAAFRRAERRRPRGPLAALALAAALAVTLAIASSLGGGALRPAQASAATVLRSAARAAALQRDRFPKAGQFLYVRVRTNTLVPIRRGGISLSVRRSNGPYELVATASWESWSPTRTGEWQTRVVAVTFPNAAARTRWIALGRPGPLDEVSLRPARLAPLGRRIPVGGPLGTLSPTQIRALPTVPRRLARELFGRVSAAAAVGIVQDLDLYPIGGPLRAAVYRALALEPGIRTAGAVRVLSGRVGVALAAANPSGLVDDELILDPATGQVLGMRTVSRSARSGIAPGTVRYETVIVARGITNRPGPPTRR